MRPLRARGRGRAPHERAVRLGRWDAFARVRGDVVVPEQVLAQFLPLEEVRDVPETEQWERAPTSGASSRRGAVTTDGDRLVRQWLPLALHAQERGRATTALEMARTDWDLRREDTAVALLEWIAPESGVLRGKVCFARAK
jgi:hypothetical protein